MATLAVRKPAEGCREEVITDPEMIEGRSSSGFQRMPVGMPTERHESTCSMREPIDRDSLDKLGALRDINGFWQSPARSWHHVTTHQAQPMSGLPFTMKRSITVTSSLIVPDESESFSMLLAKVYT
jgi:hypothetical protein